MWRKWRIITPYQHHGTYENNEPDKTEKGSLRLRGKKDLSIPRNQIKLLPWKRLLKDWNPKWEDHSKKGRYTHLLLIMVVKTRIQQFHYAMIANHEDFSSSSNQFELRPVPRSYPLSGVHPLVDRLHHLLWGTQKHRRFQGDG